MALHEKGVVYGTEEVDPFASDIPEEYLDRQPFGRVPVLSHDTFDVYETSAIARYVDAAFDGRGITIADCQLAPMIAYFTQAPEGADALSRHTALADWWVNTSKRTSVQVTDPGLPSN